MQLEQCQRVSARRAAFLSWESAFSGLSTVVTGSVSILKDASADKWILVFSDAAYSEGMCEEMTREMTL